MAVGIKQAKLSVGSVYAGTGARPALDQSVSCQFLVREQDRVSGNSKGGGKPPSRRQTNTYRQPTMRDDLTERLIQLPLKGYWRTYVQANLGDDGFGGRFQNGSFQSYFDYEY
jgi:hypothetical protein